MAGWTQDIPAIKAKGEVDIEINSNGSNSEIHQDMYIALADELRETRLSI